MKDDPESIQLREEHREFMRLHNEARDALDVIETVLPATWFGQWAQRVFARLREIWAEREEELRRAARETYDA